MKKIVIVNNNMEIGGVQKSLYNLLWAIYDRYDVTLCLLHAGGAYLQQLPPDVKIVECTGLMRYLGMSQGQCAGIHKLVRGTVAVIAKAFGRNVAVKLMLAGEKTLPGQYDCAISYLQNGNIKNLYGGVQEYVLSKVCAKKKVAFLHCDYGNCGANHPVNNRLIGRFDRIAACSEGCRRAFEAVLPEHKDRCVTVRNFHRYDEIRALASKEPAAYEGPSPHVLMVSRLAHEKGIERAITAMGKTGLEMTLHIVGGGPMERALRQCARDMGVEERVIFHGSQNNPYRYMAGADLFLLTSFHEAAPMVIDEAVSLGLPVLTVRTTSSHEMVTLRRAGWVCDNEQQALEDTLASVLKEKNALQAIKAALRGQVADNTEAAAQFAALIEE